MKHAVERKISDGISGHKYANICNGYAVNYFNPMLKMAKT
jgi:hypothetical protein